MWSLKLFQLKCRDFKAEADFIVLILFLFFNKMMAWSATENLCFKLARGHPLSQQSRGSGAPEHPAEGASPARGDALIRYCLTFKEKRESSSN